MNVRWLRDWYYRPAPWHAWYQPQSGFAGGLMAGLLILFIVWVCL